MLSLLRQGEQWNCALEYRVTRDFFKADAGSVPITSLPEPESGRRVAALDGVRGIAILVVLVHNTAFILGSSDRLATRVVGAVTATGWSGVQLFFVLSGFLITGILLDALGKPGFFRTFYLRRTLRIFPLYYAFLAITFFVVPLFADPGWTREAHANQWWYWTYTSNWAGPFGHVVPGLTHFWSLAVEEQFYLLWPFLVFAVPRRGLVALCATVIALTPVVRWGLHAAGLPEMAPYQFTIARWDALAAGAVLALLMADAAGRRWLERRALWTGGAAALGLALITLLEHGFHEDDLVVQVLGQSGIALLAAALVYLAAGPAAGWVVPIQRALSARWLRFLGKYSYAIYVVHFPIHFVLAPRLAPLVNGTDDLGRLLRVAIYIAGVAALSIVAALLSWRLLEKPFLDLKDRLAPRAN